MRPDGGLNMRGEGLYAKVDAADAHGRHGGNPGGVEAARVEFDRDFGVTRIETEQQLLKQADEIDERQRIGTTAAEGDPRDASASAQAPRDGSHLSFQRLHISGQPLGAIGRPCIAAAIPAYVVAIGDMDIEGEGRVRFHPVQPGCKIIRAHIGGELRGGGIAGVARHRLGQQVRIVGPHG